ncbi:MAG: transposase [Sedimenticola sp.]|nr:transposase [Sedimenticola sp.]
MLTLPDEYTTMFAQMKPLFSKRVWELAKVLAVGAILAPGKRTVTAVLRIMGLSAERHFQNYHRVLNRAVWSNLMLSLVLLRLLLETFLPAGSVVIGIDETIERRRGEKIKAKGIYRDPVRSSKSHFVKTSGLRWISMMLLVRIPWAKRIWGLPFLTVLAPSERYYESSLCKHKKLTDWARQMGLQVRRWLPGRKIIVVADSGYAALELLDSLASLSEPVYMVTQLRLDAALFKPAPKPEPGKVGRPLKKGTRLPTLNAVLEDPQTVWQTVTIENWYGQGLTQVEITSDTAVWYHSGKPVVPIHWVLIRDPNGKFETRALLCTDQSTDPIQILQWFVRRWQVEVTFQEVRTHLGVETQRQWSDKAIARATPVLMGLFSWVTLLADRSQVDGQLPVRQATWYFKSTPTFSDAIALVRTRIWQHWGFCMSVLIPDMQKSQPDLLQRLFEAVCYST